MDIWLNGEVARKKDFAIKALKSNDQCSIFRDGRAGDLLSLAEGGVWWNYTVSGKSRLSFSEAMS